MTEQKHLANLFEQNRSHLRAVAFRMLGSVTEAEDAVQETWLKLSRSDISSVENLPGWLTKVVARACLDMLRKRKSRPEDPAGTHIAGELEPSGDPATQAELADSIGLAMLVVLETLAPSERIAFVLHDMFAVPFDEIASLVGKSPEATRQLASRARRRVQGAPEPLSPDVERRRNVIEAFLAAARMGDFDALVTLLDPNVVLRADEAASARGFVEGRGSLEIASRAAKAGARAAQAAWIDGDVGLIIAPRGRLMVVLRLTIEEDRIVEMEAIGDTQRLATFELSILP